MTEQRFSESEYLRGREVAFRLAVRKRGEKGPPAPDGESETVWLRLGMAEVARIEEEFDGVSAFSALFEDRPTRTLVRVLAIALRRATDEASLDEIGDRLFEEDHAAYLAGVEAMWLLAHGGTEEEAGKVWRGRLTVVLDRTPTAAALFDRVLQEAERIASRGGNGSGRGRNSAGRSRSSGG